MSGAPAPYKGLRPFEDADSDVPFFFGRDRDREVIVANMMASRLTVLYGETGVGKSSVLRAGVAYHLRNLGEPLAVVVFDAWKDDPVERLKAAIAEHAGIEPMGSLVDTLELCAVKLGGEVFVVLDQTEEFFLYHDANGRPGGFVEEFADAVRRPGLRASFLLSLREDAVAKLDRFKGPIPNVLANYLRLDCLDRAAGREAIIGPLERYNELVEPDERVEIEPALVEQVLDEVTAGEVELGQAGRGTVKSHGADRRIETPFLQLVMQRLWEAEETEGSHVLRVSTLRELGGAEQIVRDHLDGALRSLEPAEKDVAAAVFNHLVTPSGTKIAHGVPDLARYAGVKEAEVRPVLATLTTERIVRPVAGEDGGPPRYEIYHDVLGEAVLSWRAGHEAGRQLERERAAAHRRQRRLVGALGAAAILLALMAGVTVFALTQRSEARSQARRAHARELAATSATELSKDPQKSLALGLQAARLEDTGQVEEALRRALLASHVRFILPGGGGAVHSAQFSDDGRLAVTASADGGARVFEVKTGALLRSLPHPAAVEIASFSPNGRLVITGGHDGKARLWRVSTGELVHRLEHAGPVIAATFSHDGRLIVTGSRDRTVRIWRADSGQLLRTIPLPKPVTGVQLSPDDTLVLVVSGDRFARLFRASDGRRIRSFPQKGTVTSAVFSPGGQLIATGSEDRTARIWVTRSGAFLHPLTGSTGRILDVAFSPRGTLVLTTSADYGGRVWNVARGDLVSTLIGHMNYVLTGAFSPNGFWVVTASRDGTARVWNARSGDPRAALVGHDDFVTSASFSRDGSRILTASDDGTARIWDSEIQPELSLVARFPRPLTSASVDPEGGILVAGPGREARLLTARGTVLRTFRLVQPVLDATLSPDGRLAATASGNVATVWDTSSGRRLLTIRQGRPVLAVAFSPDGKEIATGSADRVARIWDLRGRLIRALNRHRAPVTDVAFSSDGSRLATASEDRTARIWNAETGVPQQNLRGHRDDLTSVAFSPDGRFVVTASKDHDSRIWDVATGESIRTLRGASGQVSDASFSPDGRWVVTAAPATAMLWRVDSGEFVVFLRGHGRPLASAVFSPDGKRIVTSSADGTVRAFDCEVCGGLPQLVSLAKARLAAIETPLTPAERKRYLGG